MYKFQKVTETLLCVCTENLVSMLSSFLGVAIYVQITGVGGWG